MRLACWSNVLPTTMAGVVACSDMLSKPTPTGKDGRRWWNQMTANPILAANLTEILPALVPA